MVQNKKFFPTYFSVNHPVNIYFLAKIAKVLYIYCQIIFLHRYKAFIMILRRVSSYCR